MHDSYDFVSLQCKEWLDLPGGHVAFDTARLLFPGQWVVVHDLRPLEFIGLLFFLHRPYRPVQVIKWDEDTKVFISRPYDALPWQVRLHLPMGPRAVWASLIGRAIPTFCDFWWRIKVSFAGTSDRFDRWIRQSHRRYRHDRA